MRRREGRTWLRALALAGAVGILTGAIQEDQFLCEEAAAHLQECCPHLTIPSVCGDGCSDITLPIAQSKCILDTDCEQIVSSKMCERIQGLQADAGAVADAGAESIEVCP
jgi:hypothetical protein